MSGVNAALIEKMEEWLETATLDNKDHYAMALRKALQSVKKYPIPITSGREAKRLSGIGDFLAKKIDQFLATINLDRNVDEDLNEDAVEEALSRHTPKPNPKPKAKAKAKAKAQPKGKRKYIPAYRSGAWALLVALVKCGGKEKITKTNLIDGAAPLCDAPFTPDLANKNFYSAWSAMAGLIKRGLVETERKKNSWYWLTEEGYSLAETLSLAAQQDELVGTRNPTLPRAQFVDPSDDIVFTDDTTAAGQNNAHSQGTQSTSRRKEKGIAPDTPSPPTRKKAKTKQRANPTPLPRSPTTNTNNVGPGVTRHNTRNGPGNGHSHHDDYDHSSALTGIASARSPSQLAPSSPFSDTMECPLCSIRLPLAVLEIHTRTCKLYSPPRDWTVPVPAGDNDIDSGHADQVMVVDRQDESVECPICSRSFPPNVVNIHASTCGEEPFPSAYSTNPVSNSTSHLDLTPSPPPSPPTHNSNANTVNNRNSTAVSSHGIALAAATTNRPNSTLAGSNYSVTTTTPNIYSNENSNGSACTVTNNNGPTFEPNLELPPRPSTIEAPNEHTVSIVVDKREKRTNKDRDYFVSKLREEGLSCLHHTLAIGDICWVATHSSSNKMWVLDCVVERKEIMDLVSSVRDGRYKEQVRD